MSIPQPRLNVPDSLKKRVLSLPTLLSFLVAAAFVFFLATRFDIDWRSTWENIRGMNPWLYAAAFVAYFSSFLFRGLRWQIIATNAGVRDDVDAKLPSVVTLSSLIVIGWFVNSIAWLRLGDAYRAYTFADETRRPLAWSLGTVFAERVFDIASIFLILLASVLMLVVTSSAVGTWLIVIVAFGMALALVGIILAMRLSGDRFAGLLPARLRSPYARFQQGTLGSFKDIPSVFVLGMAGWMLEMVRLYLVVLALGLEISLVFVPIVALGHAILSTVPTPGGLGAVEPGMTGLLVLSGFDGTTAASITLVDRSITYVSVIVVGGMVFVFRQLMAARHTSSAVNAD